MICFVGMDELGSGNARTDVGYDLREVLKYYQPASMDERE